ncbi:hypothetical protein [Paraburkholderia nemoris]|uniref:hypothetical protein n=1 Tax=Paraburkholderia nemoris TaxID=2793076 RepID=UPI001B8A8D8A|nr:hypothetical protein [Paraburkholderia nemoris]
MITWNQRHALAYSLEEGVRQADQKIVCFLVLPLQRFVTAGVCCINSIGIAATINRWFPASEKGTASGIFLSAVKFGPVLTPILGATIIAAW